MFDRRRVLEGGDAVALLKVTERAMGQILHPHLAVAVPVCLPVRSLFLFTILLR